MIAFLMKRWKLVLTIILIAVMLSITFYYKTRYALTLNELEALKRNIAYQTEIQKVKNDMLRKQAEKSLQDAQAVYDNNLKAIKNEYLKKQKLDNVTINDLRDQLRRQIASDTFTLPDTSAYSSESADQWRHSYATVARQYESLVSACRMTTNDYNLLREWADATCDMVECK